MCCITVADHRRIKSFFHSLLLPALEDMTMMTHAGSLPLPLTLPRFRSHMISEMKAREESEREGVGGRAGQRRFRESLRLASFIRSEMANVKLVTPRPTGNTVLYDHQDNLLVVINMDLFIKRSHSLISIIGNYRLRPRLTQPL